MEAQREATVASPPIPLCLSASVPKCLSREGAPMQPETPQSSVLSPQPSPPPTPFPLYPGNLNLIIGRPGVGKSLLALDLAARAVHGTLPRPYLPKQKPPAQDALPKAYRPGTAAILSVEHHNLKFHLLSFGLEPRFADMPPRE